MSPPLRYDTVLRYSSLILAVCAKTCNLGKETVKETTQAGHRNYSLHSKHIHAEYWNYLPSGTVIQAHPYR